MPSAVLQNLGTGCGTVIAGGASSEECSDQHGRVAIRDDGRHGASWNPGYVAYSVCAAIGGLYDALIAPFGSSIERFIHYGHVDCR